MFVVGLEVSNEMNDPLVRIDLLGGFRAGIGDESASRRASARGQPSLSRSCALAGERQLTREDVVEALWPQLDGEAGPANLRKAAHYARRAFEDQDAVVLGGGVVSLFPGRVVQTDVADVERGAAEALDRGNPEAASALAESLGRELLPQSRYRAWVGERRERLLELRRLLLRAAGDWRALIELDPTDERAYVELMREELGAGERAAAIRWFGRLRAALREELAVVPGEEAQALYERAIADLGPDAPEIVGRDVELARLTAMLRASEPPQLLAIRGSAGIGKTALLGDLARLAREEGWFVVVVTASESRGSYAALAAIAESLLERRPELSGEIGETALSALEGLVPFAAGDPLEPPTRLTRHRVIGALRRLLLAAAAGCPVMVVVDDAHLADAATIGAFAHIGSVVDTGDPGARVVAALAYRPEAAPAELRRTAERLRRAGRIAELDLEPLGAEEAAALIAAVSPVSREPEAAQRIVALAQGNPFLIIELASSAVAGVPALARRANDVIAARFVDLGDEETDAVARLALGGGDFGPDDAVALLAAEEQHGHELLDATLRSGLIVVVDDRYRFRHELVRQALLERIPPHRRAAIAAEVAARLEVAGASPALIAARWLDAGRPEAATPWLLRAAREAVRVGGFDDALAQLAPLLEHEPGNAEALRLRAEAMDSLGEEGAPAAYASAAAAAAGSTVDELRAKRALATIKLGDPAGGLEQLEGVEPTTLDGRVAHALAHAGAAALGATDPELGTRLAAEARQLALDSDDPDSVTVASWAHAAAGPRPGRSGREPPDRPSDDARARAPCRQRFRRATLHDPAPALRLAALRRSDRLRRRACRRGRSSRRGPGQGLRGHDPRRGADALRRPRGADADLAAGAELHHSILAPTGESFASQRRAEVALQRGDRAAAAALIDRALVLARDSDVGFHLLDRIYGTRVKMASEPAAGMAALEEAGEAVRGPNETCPTCRITLAVPAAIAAAQAGGSRAGGGVGRAERVPRARRHAAARLGCCTGGGRGPSSPWPAGTRPAPARDFVKQPSSSVAPGSRWTAIGACRSPRLPRRDRKPPGDHLDSALMPGNTKRRRRKHRGTQTGSIDKRGKTTPRSRQEAMSRARAGKKTDRRDRPPTWNGAALRGGVFALLLFPMALIFHQPIAAAIILTLVRGLDLHPAGLLHRRLLLRRRMAKQAAEREAKKSARGKPRSEES